MISLVTLLAQADPIGKIVPPESIPSAVENGIPVGVISLINLFLRLIFIAAGLWAFFNVILAGFDFINAGGDPKKVSQAWEKIYKSGMGLVIIVSSFLVAAVLGMLLFKDPGAILNPKLQ